MTFNYYPGCTLKTKAKDLDLSARKAAKALGFELVELAEWQCCGAYYPMASDEIARKLSAVRALMDSRDNGNALVTLCSACHNVIKRVNDDMKNDENMKLKVNNYLEPAVPYGGEAKVMHYLEVLRDCIGFENIKSKVTNPLKDKKIAAYYGCLLLRPSDVMQFDNAENPTIIENFIDAIGGTAVTYAMRNECCGGCVTLNNSDLAVKQSRKVIDSAVAAGAEMIVTACPLCLYNLKKAAEGTDVEIKYFTEVLAESLGIE